MFHPQGPTFLELTKQALSSTPAGYDLLAPRFEVTPFRTPDPVLDAVRPVLERAPIDAALDLCCGTGAGLGLLRPLCRERLVGVDFSRGMLEVARQRLGLDAEGEGGDGVPVELVHGDVLHLAYGAEFDVVTCFGAFGHIEVRDEARFVANIARALRVGGRFVFVTCPMPSARDPRYWLARGFNAVMRVRNALIRPPFVMYYLTFTLESARRTLEAQGFELDVHPARLEPPWDRSVVVEAHLRRRPA